MANRPLCPLRTLTFPVYNGGMNTTKLSVVEDLLEAEFDKVRIAVNEFVNGSDGGMTKFVKWYQYVPTVFKIPPGVGKTKLASQLVNQLHSDGIPSIYFVANHDLADKRIDYNDWAHWYGHTKFECKAPESKADLYKLGFTGGDKCTCKYPEQFQIDKPAVTVLHHFLPDPISSLWRVITRPGERFANDEQISSTIPEVHEFGLRIVDEMNFGLFIEQKDISRKHLALIAATHPLPLMQKVFKALTDLAGNSELIGKSWSGTELSTRICSALGMPPNQLRAQLDGIALDDIPTTRWEGLGKNLPVNGPLYLPPLLRDELRNMVDGTQFNPRVHLSEWGLNLAWCNFPNYPITTLFLDASADAKLLAKGFEVRESDMVELPLEPPDNVKVHQFLDHTMTRTSLDVDNNENEPRYRKFFPKVVEDLERLLPDFKTKQIALITFKPIESEFRDYLKAQGFKVQSLHYGALRSSNDLEESDALVLFGSPIPDGSPFTRSAQAFYSDEEPLNIKWLSGEDTVHLRNGGKLSVKLKGYYGDPRTQRFFAQSFQEEIFQAVHRIRPNRAYEHETVEQLILLYTDVPVRSMQIDGFLGKFGIAERGIRSLLENRDSVGATDVAKECLGLAENHEARRGYVRYWNEQLAIAAGVDLVDGRFWK